MVSNRTAAPYLRESTLSSLKDSAPAAQEDSDSRPGAPVESAAAEHPQKADRRDRKERKSSQPASDAAKRGGSRTERLNQRRTQQPGKEGDSSGARSAQTALSREERKAARKAARKLEKRNADNEEKPRNKKRTGGDGGHQERLREGQRRRKRHSLAAENETFAEDGDPEEAQDPLAGASSAEDRRSGRRRARLTQPLSTIVRADDRNASDLFEHLQSEFALAGVQLVRTNSDADLIVNFGSHGSLPSFEGNRPIVVIFGSQNDHELLRTAAEVHGIFVPAEEVSANFAVPTFMDAEGFGNEAELRASAIAIRDSVLISESGRLVTAERSGCAPDYAIATSLAKDASEVLRALSWRGKSVPGSIRPRSDIQSIEGFLDGVIKFRKEGKREVLPLAGDWSTAPESRGAVDAVYSLDFLAAVLGYWFQKASRSSSRAIGQVDALVKQRDLTASAILARCTDVMLGFLGNARSLPEPAWEVKIAMRRARAMLLYLLCCRAAAQRRIKFDEQSLGPVFHALLDLLERLRWASCTELGEASAVARAASIAGFALPLRNTQFGKRLLEQALQALDRHLEIGLSSDGVWHEGFAGHDAVFRTLKTTVADLQSAEVPSSGLKARLVQMAQFVSAFLCDDGYSPPLSHLVPRKYRFSRAAAQALLRGRSASVGKPALEKRLQDSHIFPEAGFFVSRSAESKGRPTSHFVLHAAPVTLGGPTLSFCCGTSPLLVGGGTTDRKASPDIRRATKGDPGAHNAVRVGRRTYKDLNSTDLSSVEIAGVWEEKSWAGVQLVNRLFTPASIVRIAIHLKPLHALLVVDDLRTDGEPLQFEQFWHLGPGLELREGHPPQFYFEGAKPGGVAVAFDRSARIVLKKGGIGALGWTSTEKKELVSNSYFIREIASADALMASFFRYVGGGARHEVSVARTGSGWKVVLLCGGRQISFASESNQLKLVS